MPVAGYNGLAPETESQLGAPKDMRSNPANDGTQLTAESASGVDSGADSGAAAQEKRALEIARDHDLIRRAQSGEEEAFAGLVRCYQARAVRVARGLVPSDEDAQDLAQEAFLRVFRNLARFDFQYPFSTWLYRIVTNLCIDQLRRRRPPISTTQGDGEDSNELDLPDPSGARPSDLAEAEETADEVRSVLETLAPHFQSALVLREIEGLPCTEIAEIVGATHVTVRWRLHRGRKLFQEEWERRKRLRETGAAGTLETMDGTDSGTELNPGSNSDESQT